MTLEQLWRDAPDSKEYSARREAKITEVADYIADHLKPGLDPKKMAEGLMDAAEEMDRIHEDEIYGEVAGLYTLDGNPLTI